MRTRTSDRRCPAKGFVGPRIGLLALLLLALSYPAAAQRMRPLGFTLPVLRPRDRVVSPTEMRQIEEDFVALKVALYRWEYEKADALIERLLTRYPGQVGFRTDSSELFPHRHYDWLDGYPEVVYQARAQSRLQRENFAGAEEDFSRALRYTLPRRIGGYWDPATVNYTLPEPGGGNWGWLPRARRLTEGRARVRRLLGNAAGACADLRLRWQLDALPVTDSLFRGCDVKGLRRFAFKPEDVELLKQASLDSLRRIDAALAAPTPQKLWAALRTANHLAQGRIGEFTRAQFIRAYAGYPEDAAIPYAQRAELRERLGDYANARRDLDTVLLLRTQRYGPGSGAPYYQRGLLRLDHLQDRDGGCADLRVAYLLDTSSVGPAHPRWRGCPLPAFRRPELPEFQRREADSLWALNRYLGTGQYARALPIAAALRRGEVGNLRLNVRQDVRKFQAQEVRYARALAGAGQPQRAVAVLDSAARLRGELELNDGHLLSERGIIRLRYLHDPGGRRDLAAAARAGWVLRDSSVLAEANITAAALGRQVRTRQTLHNVAHAVPDFFVDLADENQLQLGAFGLLGGTGRDASGGVFVGMRTRPGEDWLVYSPGVGLELLAHPLVVAPKVWYEAEFLFVGGRVDLTYYRYRNQNDLRLTPQLGVSLLGYGNLFYGINIPLTGERLDVLTGHRLTLFINFLKFTKPGG